MRRLLQRNLSKSEAERCDVPSGRLALSGAQRSGAVGPSCCHSVLSALLQGLVLGVTEFLEPSSHSCKDRAPCQAMLRGLSWALHLTAMLGTDNVCCQPLHLDDLGIFPLAKCRELVHLSLCTSVQMVGEFDTQCADHRLRLTACDSDCCAFH